MGVLRMSRFRNSFIYGAFGKVGNFSQFILGIGMKSHIAILTHIAGEF